MRIALTPMYSIEEAIGTWLVKNRAKGPFKTALMNREQYEDMLRRLGAASSTEAVKVSSFAGTVTVKPSDDLKMCEVEMLKL